MGLGTRIMFGTDNYLMQLHAVNLYYKSCENLYQVLQVTQAASERAKKWKVRMIKSLSQ